MWSQHRSENEKKRGTYAIVHGRAYPRVQKGENQTNRISAPSLDREHMWRDPAIVLSDSDLDQWDGAQGANLCFEHNEADVVGVVQHTEVADDESLHLMARIPVRTPDGRDIPRGLEMVEKIRAGKIKGFSVNYDAKVSRGQVAHKKFREISLVEQPFFDGCDLTVGVMASAAPAEGEDSGKQCGSLTYHLAYFH